MGKAGTPQAGMVALEAVARARKQNAQHIHHRAREVDQSADNHPNGKKGASIEHPLPVELDRWSIAIHR